ncbi:MAG: hypothetical protein AAGA92_03560 [Planctomycetota bacterium]
MGSFPRLLVLIVLSGVLLGPHAAVAQLPAATGRQLALSDPAWKLFVPSTYEQRPGRVADLLVHFHGDPQTVWNNALAADLNALIVTVNYPGLSSAYTGPFSDAGLFQTLINDALATARGQRDLPSDLEWDAVAVSSFSAGYGAVRQVLKTPAYVEQIDAVLAADSLYATTAGDGTPLDSQMVDYKAFADLAAAGEKTFLFSHSQVPTFTYESTLETGDELLDHLGVLAGPYRKAGLGTLQFYRSAESGKFRLWGATGEDGDAHLAHLRYIAEFFGELPIARLPNHAGDVDGDGDADLGDLLRWQRDEAQAAWGGSVLTDWRARVVEDGAAVSVALVPEPSGLAMCSALLPTLAMRAVRRCRLQPR